MQDNIEKLILETINEEINNRPDYPHSINEEQERIKTLTDLRSKTPELAKKIIEEINRNKTIAQFFSGKKIFHSEYLPHDEIYVGTGKARSEIMKERVIIEADFDGTISDIKRENI